MQAASNNTTPSTHVQLVKETYLRNLLSESTTTLWRRKQRDPHFPKVVQARKGAPKHYVKAECDAYVQLLADSRSSD